MHKLPRTVFHECCFHDSNFNHEICLFSKSFRSMAFYGHSMVAIWEGEHAHVILKDAHVYK